MIMRGGMRRLANPELEWLGESVDESDLGSAVESRIGPVAERLLALAGGHANLNVRVGDDRVLRIFRRDALAGMKEVVLLGRDWQTLKTPHVIAQGVDFVLLEFVSLHPLCDDAATGRLVGRAAGEIHGSPYPTTGLLDEHLRISEPLPEIQPYVEGRIEVLGADWHEIGDAILRALDDVAGAIGGSYGAVLNHGDFKPSNLFLNSEGELVVLDWEYAFAGPPLMDVGQLLRWGTSAGFRSGFAEGYASLGGQLAADWIRQSEVLDIVNLLGLAGAAPTDESRNRHIRARIHQTLAADARSGEADRPYIREGHGHRGCNGPSNRIGRGDRARAD